MQTPRENSRAITRWGAGGSASGNAPRAKDFRIGTWKLASRFDVGLLPGPGYAEPAPYTRSVSDEIKATAILRDWAASIAADASAETRHTPSKPMGATAAGTTHAAPNAFRANQQGMSGMRANADNRNFSAGERFGGTRTKNSNFAAEESPGNRTLATEERTTGIGNYAGNRLYAGTRGFRDNRTFISGDRVAERRGNRIYATTRYGGATYGGYGQTWRGNRFVSGGVAAGIDVGLSYDSPSAYYEYPGSEYDYRVGFGGDGLYAFAPDYRRSYGSAPLVTYAPRYRVGYTAAPLYNFAPGVSTVGYARGQGCRCSP